MQLRNKLSYIALGGLLMLIGMLTSSVFMPNLFAQRDTFGEIECTSLRVVDANGKTRVWLSAEEFIEIDYEDESSIVKAIEASTYDDRDDDVKVRVIGNEEAGRVIVKGSKHSAESIVLKMDEHGGKVEVSNVDLEDGQIQLRRAKLSIDEHGGRVAVQGKDGQSGAFLVVGENGGVVGVAGKDEKTLAQLGVGDHGGRVNVVSKDGQSGAVLGIDEHGGRVIVAGNGGQSSARLGAGEHGGYVRVYGKGEGKAGIGINEYGNGAVSTWDKNGYRQ